MLVKWNKGKLDQSEGKMEQSEVKWIKTREIG